MKNTIGSSVTVTLFGESHGEVVGAVLDGLTPGVRIDEDDIRAKLSLRRPVGKISTARVEDDEFSIVSGVYQGRTTGTPLCILIPNTKQRSSDYDPSSFVPRPGHADLTGFYKYHGFEDRRGGGHFSGRLTAPIVAAGAIAQGMLKKKGICLGTHIYALAGVKDRAFGDLQKDIHILENKLFPVMDDAIGEEMIRRIEEAAAMGDSVGGILESAVLGLPAGLGEPFFDTAEGLLSHALFAIPAVKGVDFGEGFGFADLSGSDANDEMAIEDGKVRLLTNRNGGVLGGITSGAPLRFRVAVKPTPSIGKAQKSVDLISGENTELTIRGRHDPCIVHRARAVVDAITALTLLDLLAQRFGTDIFGGEVG